MYLLYPFLGHCPSREGEIGRPTHRQTGKGKQMETEITESRMSVCLTIKTLLLLPHDDT